MPDIIKILTFNVRCDWNGDGINSFVYRSGFICDRISEYKPDVIMFQEVNGNLFLDILKKMLPEFEFFGQFRNDDFTGEGLYTAVRRDRLQALAFESFWISPTPYVPGSRYENQSNCPRVCVVLKLRDIKSGEIFRTFNVHLDYISEEVRISGIKCVLEKAREYAQKHYVPFIIAGDFNAEPSEEAIKICHEYKPTGLFEATKDIKETFHDFGRRKPGSKIDYIFVTPSIRKNIIDVYAWKDENDGIYLSDHYPICMELDMLNK